MKTLTAGIFNMYFKIFTLFNYSFIVIDLYIEMGKQSPTQKHKHKKRISDEEKY